MDLQNFVARLVEVTNAHDLDAIVACFHDDYVLTNPCHRSREFVGTDQVRRNWTGIFAAVPDLRVEVLSSSAEGDRVWSEWEMRGTRTDGGIHLMRGVIVFEVTEGRARSARFFVEPVDADATTADEAVAHLTGTGP
ncbi:MAG: nuclear transport factor 2 family protein [Nocardioides sp.]